MFDIGGLTSIPSLKRQCNETATDFVPKKSKLDLNYLNDHNENELHLESPLSAKNDARKVNKKTKMVSLILNGQKEDIRIFPGQIVWCRLEKSPFWPAMVWSTKSGKIADENQRIVVKLFAKKDANVWMKLENIFPFDGLASFEKMKNSVDVHLLATKLMRSDFDFAFNICSELWARAVAEATYCTIKDREERLALFLAFSSSSNLHNSRKRSPQRRRSFELNIANSCFKLEGFKVNDEMDLIHSFIKDISFPDGKTSKNSEKVQKFVQNEEMLLKFVEQSLFSSKFKGVGNICIICFLGEPTEKLIKCVGTCDGYLHQTCFENRFPQRLGNRDREGESNYFICEDCTNQSNQFCFICKTDDDAAQSEMINCTVPNCWRRYHMNCLKDWPQAKWTDSHQNVICPSHECHQCASNVLKDATAAELTTCIKCPTALHSRAGCIHAGTIILSDSHHICIKHRKLRETICNLDYCYICRAGCNLVYCKTCPHSYHEVCLSSTPASTCANCFNVQHPVYGDIIWAKLYTYSWWPAIIVPPHCIPQIIEIENHLPHDICVCFFGENTFSWIDRESLHPFDEENFALFTESSYKFSEAVLSARKWFSQAKYLKLQKPAELSSIIASTDSASPAPYTNISENILVAPATLFLDTTNEASPCQCYVHNVDPCSVFSNCLNRASCIECNDLCPSDERCQNKCIQQGKYAEVELKDFGNKGFGLTSAEEIICGTIVSQYTGEVITSSEFERRMKDTVRSNVFFMKYTKDLYIDAETKGSLARFINHSCNPNCSFRLWSVNGVNVVAVVALKDIPKDTEITCKYGWSRNIPCLCNEDNCTGFC